MTVIYAHTHRNWPGPADPHPTDLGLLAQANSNSCVHMSQYHSTSILYDNVHVCTLVFRLKT